MKLNRRPRSQREPTFSCCRDPKSVFYIITVAAILSIVFLEDVLREISLESRFLTSTPDANLGAISPEMFNDVQPAKTKENIPPVVGQSLTLSNHGNEQSRNGSESIHSSRSRDRLTPVDATDLLRSENTPKSDPGSEAVIQPSSSASDRLQLKNAGSKGQGASLNRSSSEIVSTASTNKKQSSEGRWINVDEFRRRAEERAMYDALKKRAALLSRDEIEGGNKTLKLSSEDEASIMMALDNAKEKKGRQQLETPEFRGVVRTKENSEVFKADNVTYLSFMVYRLVKTHNLTSLLDIPCTKSMYWMPEVLSRLEFEVPNFHYRCITPDDDYLVEAILRFKDLTSAVVLKDANFWASKLPQASIAFTWYGIGYLAPSQSWQLLRAIHQSKTKYVLIPNHPDVVSNPGSESRNGRVNVRRSPYRFDEALRVVNNISDTFPRKQLLMYELEGLRSDVL